MDVPIELRVLLSELNPEDSRELKEFFSQLPTEDLELRDLVQSNIDGFIRLLCSTQAQSS